MSNFRTDQFNIRPYDNRGLAAGISQAGASIASGAHMLAEKKERERQRKEMQEQMDAATDMLRKSDQYADKKTGLIDVGAVMKNLPKGLDPKIQSGLVDQITEINKQREEQNAADIERASLSLAYQDRDGSTYDSLLPGLHDEAYAKSMQEWQGARGKQLDQEKTQLDMRNTQSLINERGSPSAKLNEKEKEIQGMLDMGFSHEDAFATAHGHTRVVTDPTTGASMLVNVATGEGHFIKIPELDQMVEEAANPGEGASESEINLYGMSKTSTGLWVAARDAMQRVSGQAGLQAIDPEIQQNMQVFQAAKQELVRALVLSKRFNFGEMETIRTEIDVAPSAWKDVQTLQAKIEGVNKALADRLQNEIHASRNKTLSAADRSAALSSANSIRNFMRILGVPQKSSMSFEDAASKYAQ